MQEIEKILKSHKGVKDAVVLTRENKKGKTEIYAYYVDETSLNPVVWPSVGEYPLYDDYVYYAMTNDEVRNYSYKAAIARKAAGKVVVEIGTGKDVILAQLCVEAGARIVYAIEISENSFKKAQHTVKKLGLQDKIILIHGDATCVEIPEPADICLSEVIGTIGGSEGAAAILKNARRFLKNKGEMIPDKCITKIAAVQLPSSLHQSPAFSRMSSQYVETLYRYSGHPFDFRICIDNFPISNVISSDGIFENLDFSGRIETEGQSNVELVVSKDGRMDGFLLWLNLYTCPGVLIDNLVNRHCWAPVFIPVMYPGVTVSTGDRIRMTCSWSLSQNGINPDYRLEGVLILKDGTEISIQYELPYFEIAFLKNPFYRQLLIDNPAGHARNIFEYLDPMQLRLYLQERLPSYMLPAYLVELPRIPLTTNGKVDKQALPKPTIEKGNAYAPPRDEIETKLVEIWSHVLGIEKEEISIDANFFHLGGHSLKAAILTSRIHKELNVSPPLTEVFKIPYIRGLAAYIKKAAKTRHIPVEPVEKKDYYPLSSAQRRLYIIQQMEDNGGTGYNMPEAYQLEGMLHGEKIEKIFRQLIRRYESLRTFFTIVNDEPAQRIHDEVELKIEYNKVDVEDMRSSHLEGTRGLAPLSIESAARNRQPATDIIRSFIRSFDLSQAPLLRVGLIKIDGQKHILMADMHHIISDGLSGEILIREFTELYDGKNLPPLKLQYKDYSQWQNSQVGRDYIKEQETYWLKQFADETPLLNLPADYPRPAVQNFSGQTLHFEVNGEETAALKSLTHQQDVTLFMLLLSVYTVFLCKLSGQEDIVVGTPIAGRRHTDLENIMGMFVNTLALRNFPLMEKNFNQFLIEVGENTLNAFENQDYLYEDLVEQVVEERDSGRNPLFDTMFTLQNMDTPDVQIPGLKILPYPYESRISKFDLTLTAVEIEDRLAFTFQYCTHLFKKETIQRFTAFFKKTISTILENLKIMISAIEIISEEEKNQVLYTFNDTTAEYPRAKTIHQLFAEQTDLTPHHIALVGRRNDGPFSLIQLTYSELNEISGQLALSLQQKGIHPDTIVGLTAERSIETIINILSILKAGGAFLPIEPEAPQERVNYLLKDSRGEILLNAGDTKSLGDRTQAGIMSYRSPGAKNLAYLIYTSGSTGRPKGVGVQHRNLVNYSNWFVNQVNLKPGQKLLLTHSFSFDAAYTNVFSSLLKGCQLHITAKETYLEPETLLNYISTHRITHLKFIPSLFATIANHTTLLRQDLKCIRFIMLGGEAIQVNDVETFHRAWPHIPIMNHYGPTETTIGSIARWLDWDKFDQYKQTPDIGKPIDNTRVYIIDKAFRLPPIDLSGELCISGTGLAVGYINRPELTAEKFDHELWDYQDYRDGYHDCGGERTDIAGF